MCGSFSCYYWVQIETGFITWDQFGISFFAAISKKMSRPTSFIRPSVICWNLILKMAVICIYLCVMTDSRNRGSQVNYLKILAQKKQVCKCFKSAVLYITSFTAAVSCTDTASETCCCLRPTLDVGLDDKKPGLNVALKHDLLKHWRRSEYM